MYNVTSIPRHYITPKTTLLFRYKFLEYLANPFRNAQYVYLCVLDLHYYANDFLYSATHFFEIERKPTTFYYVVGIERQTHAFVLLQTFILLKAVRMA